ncbi:MAG: hypothetical protein J6U54_24270 [Clostridiales bacterium]|nr:hypothetical protein [Clostridiales bacterium]
MKLKGVLIFSAGLCVGAIGGALITKHVMRERTEAEIESVKDAFKQLAEEERLTLTSAKEAEEKNAQINSLIDNYRGEKEMNETTTKTGIDISGKAHLEPKINEPYCIDPDEFGEKFEDMDYLTYYSDGTLAYDDTLEIVEHPDELIGKENLYHFGEFEEDMLYVRNPKERVDYCITHADVAYSDRG